MFGRDDWPRTFHRTARLVLVASIGAFVGASITDGSLSDHGNALPLKSLSTWLLHTGKESVVRKRILEKMDLPNRDMPVRERGFRYPTERITHVCSVSTMPGYEGLLFLAQVDESDGSAVVWRTGLDGILVSTVLFSENRVDVAPNEQYASGFMAEKSIFLLKMRLPARTTE